MAKELPYFKFETSEWDNGTIQMCSKESKGLFIDLCSMYWARLGEVKSKLAVQKLCNGDANALQELIEEEIIEIIDDKIAIHFLDVQLKDFNAVSDKRKKAAEKRWLNSNDSQLVNANAMQMQSKCNAIREEKSKEKNINIDFDLLLEFFNKTYGRSLRIVSDKTKKQIKERLKEGYSKEDLKQALLNAKNDPYHIENNFKYITLEFISRSDKFERYSQIHQTNVKPRMI
jgi:uncharacterized phage protein (TIGR02220 family)